MLTGIGEFDRVLGGGVVAGSLVLIGGAPGIGKSTLLLEAAVRLSAAYGSGRLGRGIGGANPPARRPPATRVDNLMLASETDLAVIESHIRDARPAFAIVDSIQTVAHPGLDSAPGTLTQVREGATALQRLAKEGGTPIFIVGHVNKEGWPPRAGTHRGRRAATRRRRNYNFRILRALKNRFGSTNEMGVFEMGESGMTGVENPSQLFLSERQSSAPGS